MRPDRKLEGGRLFSRCPVCGKWCLNVGSHASGNTARPSACNPRSPVHKYRCETCGLDVPYEYAECHQVVCREMAEYHNRRKGADGEEGRYDPDDNDALSDDASTEVRRTYG